MCILTPLSLLCDVVDRVMCTRSGLRLNFKKLQKSLFKSWGLYCIATFENWPLANQWPIICQSTLHSNERDVTNAQKKTVDCASDKLKFGFETLCHVLIQARFSNHEDRPLIYWYIIRIKLHFTSWHADWGNASFRLNFSDF